jgi:hypothetical protein
MVRGKTGKKCHIKKWSQAFNKKIYMYAGQIDLLVEAETKLQWQFAIAEKVEFEIISNIGVVLSLIQNIQERIMHNRTKRI